MEQSKNYRIWDKTITGLRRLEKEEKRSSNISASIEYLLKFRKLVKDLDRDLYDKIKFWLN
jgi:hypothetical protein